MEGDFKYQKGSAGRGATFDNAVHLSKMQFNVLNKSTPVALGAKIYSVVYDIRQK